MRISMELLSDAIFGNGLSIPGGEDISVLHDENGFPYFKGNTLKGIFREELLRLLEWQGKKEDEIRETADELLGRGGDDSLALRKLVFSDLVIPESVKEAVLTELWSGTGEEDVSDKVLNAFTNLRVFTALEEDGMVKRGSLRVARCVNRGICLNGEIRCSDELRPLVRETIGLIKWVGTMRNRGFGQVRITDMDPSLSDSSTERPL